MRFFHHVSPLPREMIQFDEYFANWLKPPPKGPRKNREFKVVADERALQESYLVP